MDDFEQGVLDDSLVEPLTVPAPVGDLAGQQNANLAARKTHNKIPYPDAGFPSETPTGVGETRQRRKRRTKAEMEAMRAFEESQSDGDVTVSTPKRSGRPRVASKLNGADVTQGMCLAFAGVAMLTRQGHWQLDPKEVGPWANEAAELLNRIPSRYVRAVTDLSGYLIVGTGLYGCMAPRIAMSQQIAAEKRVQKLSDDQREAVVGAEMHLSEAGW